MISDAAKEKQKLRKRLKDFVRSSVENAQKVNMIIENLTAAKSEYEIQEMIRVGMITHRDGMFHHKGNTIDICRAPADRKSTRLNSSH